MHDGAGHAYMALDKAVETGKAVTIRMLGYILLVQFAAAHTFMPQTFAVGRQKRIQDSIAWIVDDRFGSQGEQLAQTGVFQTHHIFKVHMKGMEDL